MRERKHCSAGQCPAIFLPSFCQPPSPCIARRVGSKAEGLEATLTGRLDPIDWATYEPFLYANERRALSRCHVLFGLLGDMGGKAEAPMAAARGAGTGSNKGVLAMAAAGPRLAYLPINTPASVQRQTSGGAFPVVSEAAAAAASMLLLSGDGDGNSCSFAALKSSGSSDSPRKREDASVVASSSGGVGAAAMEALGRARAAMGESFAAGLRPHGLLSSLTSFGGQIGRQ